MRRVGLLLIVSCFGCVALNPAYFDSQGDESGGGSGSGNSVGPTTDSAGTDSAGSGPSSGPSGGDTEGESSAGETPAQWEFTDDEADEFEAGDLHHLEFDADALALEIDRTSGRTTSRIFTTGGPQGRLMRLEWEPEAPYGVGMFGPGVDEFGGYAYGGANTDRLELLLRFDDETELAMGAVVPDGSIDGNDGTVGGEALQRIRGVFKGGVRNSGDAYIVHPTAALAPATRDFTWTAWYRNQNCGSGQTIMAYDAPDLDDEDTESVWLACGLDDLCAGPPSGVQGAAYHINMEGSVLGPAACSGDATIGDSDWHHLAMRLIRENEGLTLQLFIDGEEAGDESIWESQQFDFAQGPEQTFTTVGNREESYTGVGEFDEITVWDRALDSMEIKHLYSRGASNVVLRVRACMEEDCSDDPPFAYPSGTDGFRDSGPHLGHGHDLEPFNLVGVAFQYELHMDATTAAPSPRLPRVSMFAEPADD